MSRHQREFIELRKQALAARKERYIRRTDSAVPTLPIIAQKLMTTSMISGRHKHHSNVDNNSWQREDRVLLSAPGSNKRKIGPKKYDSREGFQRDQIEGLQQEVEAPWRNLIDANAQIQLQQHNSASTVQLSQFQI
jgi:hypothetical protein